MKKISISLLLLCISTLISINCSNSIEIADFFPKSPAQLFPILKGLLLDDNFVIAEENEMSGILTSEWRKLTDDENNSPDPTIEGKIEITLRKTEGGSVLKAIINKRSSMFSNQKTGPEVTYQEVGLFNNDNLYIEWDRKISALKERK
jgi:hypothetical protein